MLLETCVEEFHCHLADLPEGYPAERLLEIRALRILQGEEQEERMKGQ